MNEHEALTHLLQGYFHQDWDEDYDGDPWRAVGDFARGEPDLAPRVRHEIHHILASEATEEDLRQLVRGLQSGYLPDTDGWTYRDWLAAVADRVDRQLERRGSFTCPACGYPDLKWEPYPSNGEASGEICPSCGFEFGVTDDRRGFTFEQWRQRWIARGMPWVTARVRPVPDEWDPREQLRRLLDSGHEAG